MPRELENDRQLFEEWERALEGGRVYGFACSKTMREETFLGNAGGFEPLLAGVFDNDRRLHGASTAGGRPVVSPEKLAGFDGKILIFYWNDAEVAGQLRSLGLRMYRDFWPYRDFLTFYHWHKHKRVFMPATDVSLTQRCTLKCRDCSMLITEMARPQTPSLESLQSDIDTFFTYVDYQHRLFLMGGEPLLHPDLPRYLEYLGRRYRPRIYKITIITNGTIVPKPDLLDLCGEHGVDFSVSDYSEAGIPGYAGKLARTLETLNRRGCPHTVSKPAWNLHHCREEGLASLSHEQLRGHYLRCRNQACRGLADGKFYPCFKTWSAELCGRSPNAPGDCIDLAAPDSLEVAVKQKLVRYILGDCDNGFLNHCRKCYGFDPEYRRPVVAARQEA